MSSSTGSSFSDADCRLCLKPNSLRGALTRLATATDCCAFDNTRSGNGPIKMRGRVCLPEDCVDSAGGVGIMLRVRALNNVENVWNCGCHSALALLLHDITPIYGNLGSARQFV